MNKTNLLGVRIDCVTRDELFAFLKSGKKAKIAKVNSEFLLRALKNGEFKETLNGFDLNITDGSGVLWAARYLSLPLRAKKFRIHSANAQDRFSNFEFLIFLEAIGQMIWTGASLVFCPKYCRDPIPERFPGVEAMYLMLSAAEESGKPVFLLGAEQGVSDKTVKILKERYPKIIIAGNKGGYWENDHEVVEEINRSNAEMLFVALGSPKQENWIRDNFPKLEKITIAVGEGGSLDKIAGSSKKAPNWMMNMGIEWLWRIFFNKSKSATGGRMKRVWNAVPIFIYEVVKYKIKNV